MEAAQIMFILSIIRLALEDYKKECLGHDNIHLCSVCKNRLSAVLFFQSGYSQFLKMLGFDFWIHPYVLEEVFGLQGVYFREDINNDEIFGKLSSFLFE